MHKPSRFLFEHDFKNPDGGVNPKHGADLRAAEERGYATGMAEGRRSSRDEAEARLAHALEGIAGTAGELLARIDACRAEVETDAIAFALALGRKLAGEALETQPLAAIAEAARGAFQHLRGVPHVVVRVNDTLVEDVERLMGRLARERGFEGRIVVLGEPEIGAHDVRLEWADGGVVRDAARIEAAAAGALATARGNHQAPPENRVP